MMGVETHSISYINEKPFERKRSFRSMLEGQENGHLLPTISPYTMRKLKPFIWRDFETRPAKLRLLEELQAFHHLEDPLWEFEQHPLDYCYFRPSFTRQINDLLKYTFWPGIDVSEWQEYPDYTICAVYKKLVIGCGLMTPEGYITYLVVHPEWRASGIATFMLYHLIQTITDKDLTLHVSTNNSAMILYQKFGFKPEEFILDFYLKFYPDDSPECKHAFFLRLKR